MIDFDAFSTPFISFNGNPMYHVDLDEMDKVFINISKINFHLNQLHHL